MKSSSVCLAHSRVQKNISSQLFFFSIWLYRVWVVACRMCSCGMQTLSCGMWDLVSWPGIKPRPPALGGQSLSHWTTSEIPVPRFWSWNQEPSQALSDLSHLPSFPLHLRASPKHINTGVFSVLCIIRLFSLSVLSLWSPVHPHPPEFPLLL